MARKWPAPGQASASAEATPRCPRLATFALGAVVLVLVGLSVPIGILARKPIDPLALLGVLVAALGLLIARRQPGNRIGLLLTGFGALLVFYEDAARYSVADYTVHHGTLPLGFPAVVIASELWSGLFLVPPLIIAILLGSGAWQMQGTRIAVQGNGQLVGNPGPSGALGFVLLTAFLAVPVFWTSFVTRQILSWRRATGERRAQLKWLMAGSVATVIGLAGTFLLQSFAGLLGALDNAAALVLLGHPVADFPDPGSRGRIYAGGGGVIQSTAAPGAASGGSALQHVSVWIKQDS